MFTATVTVPSAFNVNPVGTLTAVNVTCPDEVPITAGFPFKVSLVINDTVVPQDFRLLLL